MVRHTDEADDEPFLNTDAEFISDLPNREPRTATEVRMLIGAASQMPAGSYIQGFESDKTCVIESERDDGTRYVHGKIGISHSHEAAYKQAKKVVNYAGGTVTAENGKVTKRAGTHGVSFRFDLPEEDDEPEAVCDGGEPVEDEDDTPNADRLAKELVDRVNSHGLTHDAVAVHNDVCVTVDTTASTHRGNVQEMTPGLLSTARREGWYAQSISFDDETITFRRDR